MKKLIVLPLAFFLLTGMGWLPSHRTPPGGPRHETPVAPELDVGAGGLALGLVGIGVALIRERKRRG